MDIFDKLNQYLFSISGNDIFVGDVLMSLLSAVLLLGFYFFVKKSLLPWYHQSKKLDVPEQKKLHRVFVLLLFLVWLTITFLVFELDFSIHQFDFFDLRLSTILKALLVVQLASLFIRLTVESILYSFHKNVKSSMKENGIQLSKGVVSNTIRYARLLIILFTGLVLLNLFHIDFVLFETADIDIRISRVLMAIIVLLGARIFIWILTELVLANFYGKANSKNFDEGNRYAINRLLSYFIFTLAFLFALSTLGLNLTIIWGGTAALLVGVGLGLQQTFNDVFSGILLLFERSVEVGDWVELESHIGRVVQIGLRTSVVRGRDDISVIVPNSKLVTDKVINWSHIDVITRFDLDVGVAYGSDTALVKQILEDVVAIHPRIMPDPAPFVRLTDFGESSLDFKVLFWAKQFYSIEDIKSDLRFEIDKAFREKGIVIPFPQRDVWMR